jgi:hypothetical protein
MCNIFGVNNLCILQEEDISQSITGCNYKGEVAYALGGLHILEEVRSRDVRWNFTNWI